MVSSSAKTVSAYLKALPAEKRTVISRVRNVIRKGVKAGFKEVMQYGMISYVIPLEKYPNTYNDQALALVSVAAQKNHYAIYLMNIYSSKTMEKWFKAEWKKTGKKMNMGKSCIRFSKLDDIPLELIGKAVGKTSVKDFIAYYEKSRKKN